MNDPFEVVGVTSHDNKHFAEIGSREGVKMMAIQMVRPIALIADLAALWKLYRLIKALQPKIVHTQTPKAGLLGMLAAWLARVPVRVHTVGGLPLLGTRGFNRSVLTLAERITYACAHRVLVNSRGLIEIMRESGLCDTEKIRMLASGSSNGVDTDYFRPDYDVIEKDELRKSLNLLPSNFVFLYIGRLAVEKGIIEMLNAFDQVASTRPGIFKLILIGVFEKHYGMLTDDAQKSILSNPNILHLGRFDDVRPYYKIADVNLLPSYREGFPNTVLEASAMQLPSIVTDINGCNEIVEHRVNGLVIPVKNSTALKDAMLELSSSSELRHVFGANSRLKVVEKYRREVVCKAILDEYKALMSKLSVSERD